MILNSDEQIRQIGDHLVISQIMECDGQGLPRVMRVRVCSAAPVPLPARELGSVWIQVGDYGFTKPAEDTAPWENWFDARIEEVLGCQRYLDSHPWEFIDGSTGKGEGHVPDLVLPGTYVDADKSTYVVSIPHFRRSTFRALSWHPRSGRATRQTWVEGESLQPLSQLTCPPWQAALHRQDSNDLSRRNLSAFQGCLLGAAVGDALGAAVNDMSLAALRACYGAKGIREFSPTFGRLGAVTSHTQMSLFTGEGLIRAAIRGSQKGICHPPAVVYHAYCRWMLTQNERPGSLSTDGWYPDGWLVNVEGLKTVRRPSKTAIEALRLSEMGTRERPTNDSKGCAALARIAPAGLTGWHDAFTLGSDLGALTHGNPTGYLAAGFLAALIEALVEGESLRWAIGSSRDVLRADPAFADCIKAIDSATELAETATPTPENLQRLGTGRQADEALAICLFSSLATSSFRDGVRLAVNHGGDSDATGAITGAILGTLYGREAIPERWLEALELREEIEALATDLYLEFGNCPYSAALGASDWARYPGW